MLPPPKRPLLRQRLRPKKLRHPKRSSSLHPSSRCSAPLTEGRFSHGEAYQRRAH
jgi:hypothetical protein